MGIFGSRQRHVVDFEPSRPSISTATTQISNLHEDMSASASEAEEPMVLEPPPRPVAPDFRVPVKAQLSDDQKVSVAFASFCSAARARGITCTGEFEQTARNLEAQTQT